MKIEDVKEEISIFYGAPISVITDCIRGFVCAAPGNKLICVDLASIEGRMLAWFANQESALKVYRTHGKIYEHEACNIYNINRIEDVTSDQRQIGKVATLALGYQGGVGAFQSMAKNYFVKVPDERAEQIKVSWRESNTDIVSFWYALEEAAINATQYTSQKFSAGYKNRRVIFLRKGSFLFCRLPSGRAICYPYPKMRVVMTPWGEPKNALTYMGEDSFTHKWVRKVAYGGLICENVTQATARDILVEALHRWELHNYTVIMHVHDEGVAEVPKNFGSVKEAEELFCVVPSWAKDLPINAHGWQGKRYRK